MLTSHTSFDPFQLAKLGFNVVLVSRTKSKLETVANEIGSKYNVQTKTIAVDFTGGIEIFESIKAQIQSLDIGVLVNNVGMSYDNPEYFHSIPNQDKFLADLVNCNIVSVTNLCKIVLPGMVSSQVLCKSNERIKLNVPILCFMFQVVKKKGSNR